VLYSLCTLLAPRPPTTNHNHCARRVAVFYSLCALLAVILGTMLVRYVVWGAVWLAGGAHLWLLPNLMSETVRVVACGCVRLCVRVRVRVRVHACVCVKVALSVRACSALSFTCVCLPAARAWASTSTPPLTRTSPLSHPPHTHTHTRTRARARSCQSPSSSRRRSRSPRATLPTSCRRCRRAPLCWRYWAAWPGCCWPWAPTPPASSRACRARKTPSSDTL
jgi:hypothetical protein